MRTTMFRALVPVIGFAGLGVATGCTKASDPPPAASAPAEEPDRFGELTVDQVQKLVESKQAAIFDNNSEERWKQSHVPTAKWLAFNEVKASVLPADKATTLVFYCASPH